MSRHSRNIFVPIPPLTTRLLGSSFRQLTATSSCSIPPDGTSEIKGTRHVAIARASSSASTVYLPPPHANSLACNETRTPTSSSNHPELKVTTLSEWDKSRERSDTRSLCRRWSLCRCRFEVRVRQNKRSRAHGRPPRVQGEIPSAARRTYSRHISFKRSSPHGCFGKFLF